LWFAAAAMAHAWKPLLPVGLFTEAVYQAQAVPFFSGDLIVGVEGLLAAVKHCRPQQPESVVEAVFAALDKFAGDNQTDDATILAALVH
jgi:hypothetical protein